MQKQYFNVIRKLGLPIEAEKILMVHLKNFIGDADKISINTVQKAERTIKGISEKNLNVKK
jgi:hypothetical protein